MSSFNPFAKKKEDTGSASQVTPKAGTSSGLFSS
jgi:hypothetical protein